MTASTRRTKRGRALSPSRLLVLETLESTAEPLSLPSLVARVKLHENTVRGHLDALLTDGFVSREQAYSEGRGRPSWLWFALEPAHQPASTVEYAGLASALANTISTTAADPVSAARAAGEDWGQELVANGKIREHDPASSAAEHVAGFLEDFGFAPRVIDESTIKLHRCPLLDAATKHPDVVCNVHLGLVAGALAEGNVDATAQSLTPFTAPGVCTLRLAVGHASKTGGRS